MMWKYFTTAWFVFLMFVGAPANAEETADEAKVAAATRLWIDTFNTRDAARITALYAPDAVLWGTVSQTIRTTHDEILEYFIDSSKKRPDLRMFLGEYHVQLLGDLATNSGYYTSRNPVDGKEVVIPMRFTFMYRREGDQWVIVNHHSSRFAATP
jgi:uncharacterized protein (TIGR02246 family)